ncbi:hypothetical protein MTO96_024844 [Rhipicephalus appendiculatus]
MNDRGFLARGFAHIAASIDPNEAFLVPGLYPDEGGYAMQRAKEERTSISVNEGQQTELPCITRQPAFNGTHNVQRVRWFHEPHFRLGRDIIYTVDVGGQNTAYPSERGSNPNQVR